MFGCSGKPSRGTTRRASLAESWRGGEHGTQGLQGGQNHGIQPNLLLMLALPLGEMYEDAAVSLIMTLVTVMPQA